MSIKTIISVIYTFLGMGATLNIENDNMVNCKYCQDSIYKDLYKDHQPVTQ